MVSGGFSFLYHTSGGGAAGKYWLRGHECATSPAELGRNPECRVGQVMVEWPEADNAWFDGRYNVFYGGKNVGHTKPLNVSFLRITLIPHRKL